MTERTPSEDAPNPGMQVLVNHLLEEVSRLSTRAVLAEANLELVTAERDALVKDRGVESNG